MFSAKSSRKSLSELEHLIMNVVWERTSVTAEDVRESLAGRHPMKDSTVRTILTRLETKGYVKRKVAGRTNVYTGKETPEHVAVRSVRQIIDAFCGGSLEALLTGMVDKELVDEQELQRLAIKIARRKRDKEA